MRYIHVGSTSVYGPYRGTPLTEDAPRNPQDNYGRSKRDGEDIVWQRIAEGLAATITRPYTVYGPGCNDGAGKVFSRPTSITAIPGNGRQLLSNVRAEDVAAAVVHLSHLDEAVGKAFNIADDSHPTLEEALSS
jgi:UDP-glucose 4-epimerase